MCRRTIKVHDGHYHAMNDSLAIQKLGVIEDLEAKMGISIMTLAIAMKNGIYYRDCWDHSKIEFLKPDGTDYLAIGEKELMHMYLGDLMVEFDYKDYGKTWSVTKEDLK